ncbi:unnamed protein product [Sphenostylis stenocarpa]|uniref:DRBM domain-containing protein n=1 Tax=Sphenostylis stenocarpa TaxID=92480 RepID=A0AA86VSV2_9FABA|nr:unnamed protein product [Sphenostylis stenocarpa]
MYKTKLQELCHQRRWGLPKYSAVKDGPDHIPSFKASVYVNGVSFTSSSASSSLKEAKNQAAMLVPLLFFLDEDDGLEIYDSFVMVLASDHCSFPFQHLTTSINSILGMDCIHKNQLPNNARMNSLDSSVFACKTEDLPPANDFKTTVLVNGQSIESPSFSNTIKETNQASHLMSLLPDFFKGDSDSFKTKLMKLTEKESCRMPTYKTMQTGSFHMPTFFSTLEVEGVEFHGKGCRSKKDAEEDAAKIAYIALKQCGLNMYTAFSPSQIEHKSVLSILNSDIVKCIQNVKLEDLNETLLANVKVSNEEVQNSSFLQSPDE